MPPTPVNQDGPSRPAAPPRPISRSKYMAGQVVGNKYRLTRLIGEGGMGSVWRARNQALDIDVALKVIRAGSDDADAAGLLLREARSAAKLEHPSIVRIFDFGESGRDPFIVMELLRGESLGCRLDACGRLPPTRALSLLLPVAGGLAAAHAKGVVHRDLKPQNIMLSIDDQDRMIPKIVDFGIAAMPGRSEHPSCGSHDYMSPEQVRGIDVDERADVWGLAVVLYEALTGCRPFLGTGTGAVLKAIVDEEPMPITAYGAGDEELSEIIARGLAKDLERRWPSMRAFGQALASWGIRNGVHTDVTGTALAVSWQQGTPNPTGEHAASSGEASKGRDGHDPPATMLIAASQNESPSEGDDREVELDGVARGVPPRRSVRAWGLLAAAAFGGALLALLFFRSGNAGRSTTSRIAARPVIAAASTTVSEPTAPASVPAPEPAAPTTASAAAAPAAVASDPIGTDGSKSPPRTPARRRSGPPRTTSRGMPLPSQPNF
jgi:eukaryotic-like serine/threonine-protein kinase